MNNHRADRSPLTFFGFFKEFFGFFRDDKGKSSCMRLMCFMSLIAAIMFGMLTLTSLEDKDQESGMYITFSFLLASFAPKAIQKIIEVKYANESSKSYWGSSSKSIEVNAETL